MPKRRSSSSSRPRVLQLLGVIAALAVVVFALGELWAFATSDLGRVLVYRHLHVGDRANLVRIAGKRVREGLAAARVPHAAQREEIVAGPAGGTPRWHVRLPEDGAPLQVNLAVTRAVEAGGASVLSGREDSGPRGALTVTLVVGVPGRALQEVVIERPARHPDEPDHTPRAELALVLFGFGEQPGLARTVLARGEPFAVAVPATGDGREALRDAAHRSGHEVVLQVPMEPEKYPRVNPGPGTLLVSMSQRRIEGAVRDALDEAGTVVAVANLMGSFATQDEPFMTAVYRALHRASVPFLHVSPVPRAVCRPLAAKVGVAYDEVDAVLDGEARAQTPAALQRSWRAVLERVAGRRHGIVFVRMTPMSERWLETALAPAALGDVRLAPLSSIQHAPAGD